MRELPDSLISIGVPPWRNWLQAASPCSLSAALGARKLTWGCGVRVKPYSGDVIGVVTLLAHAKDASPSL